jgi:hypothetical protein
MRRPRRMSKKAPPATMYGQYFSSHDLLDA